jgi:hypothetical protein
MTGGALAPPDTASGPRRHRPSGTAVLLGAGLVVQLLPLLLFPIVLSQDGAAHVDGAWVLIHHGDAGPLGAVLREQYRIDLAPVPNMFTTLVLAGLVRVVSADAAEKLLVAAFAVALVAAVGYAVRGVDGRAGWLAVAALPLVGSQLAGYGFYNFCWGVVGAVLVLGIALRRRAGWSVPATVALAVVLTLTWSAHLLPFAVAVLGLGLFALARIRMQLRDGGALPAALVRHALPPVLALLPGLALSARYAVAGTGTLGAPAGWPSPGRVAELISGFRPLVVDSWLELAPALVVVGTLGYLGGRAAGWWPRRPAVPPAQPPRSPERGALALLLACCTVAFVGLPDRFGDNFGFLPERLAWFPFLLLVLWCATRPTGRRLRLVATVLLVVAASVAVVIRLPAQAAAAGDAREFLSVSGAVRPGSDFVVLRYSRSARGPLPVTYRVPDYLRHESSRLAIRADSADVGLYEAETPYFQVTFDGGPEVWRRLVSDPSDLEKQPPIVDLAAARGRLDYVVVVGLDRAGPEVRHDAHTQGVLRELTANYQLVKVSSPTGLASVWRFRGATPG